MITFYGQVASFGQGMGVLVQKKKLRRNRVYSGGVIAELDIFEEACKLADTQYEQMVTEAKNSFGDAVAMMVWSHQLLIQDEGFRSKIKELIQSENISANQAIMSIAMEYVQLMSDSLDAYLRERGQDIIYVAEWLMDCCSIVSERDQVINCELIKKQEKHPVIIIGRNFGLEDVLVAKQNQFSGMIDIEGSLESHTVMLAKELKIPMLIKLKEEIKSYVNRLAMLNAVDGCIQIE